MNIKIVDIDGEWVKCMGVFGLTDPTTSISFPHMQATKVKLTEWLKLQLAEGVFQTCEAPAAVSAAKVESVVEKQQPPKK